MPGNSCRALTIRQDRASTFDGSGRVLSGKSVMKITGPNSVKGPEASTPGRRPVQGGFVVSGSNQAAPAALARGVSGVGSVDALLALQEVDEPLGRRRRAVKRAGKLLDILDQLKLTLLTSDPGVADVQRLAAAVREERAVTGDPGLESVLDQIETRAAVELAKIEARLGAS